MGSGDKTAKLTAVIVLGAGLLAACGSGTGGPTDSAAVDQPTTTTTGPGSTSRASSQPTPRHSATPTATTAQDPAYLALSTEQRKAFDQAVDAYRQHARTVGRIGESGQYTNEEIKRELAKTSGGDRERADFLILRTYRIKGELQVGDSVYLWFKPTAVNLDLRKSRAKHPEVRMLICSDNAKVRMLDAENRKVIWAPKPGETKSVSYAKLLYVGATWRVYDIGPDDEDKGC